MANIRIKDQTTDTALAAGDYVIVDSESEGTRKFDLGTELTGIKEDFSEWTSNFESVIYTSRLPGSGTITTNVAVGTVVDITSINSSAAWGHVVVPVHAGEWFKITGKGGEGARLWALLNSDCELLEKSNANITVADYVLKVHEDGYAVFNMEVAITHYLYYHHIELLDDLEDIENQIENLESTIDKTSKAVSGAIRDNVSVGTVVDVTNISANDQWKNIVVPVKKGDWIVFTGTGGDNARLWALLNTDYELVDKSAASITLTDYTMRITADGYVVFNFNINYAYSVVYHGITITDTVNDSILTDLSDKWAYGYIATNANVGESVPFTYKYSGSYYTHLRRCYSGERYIISGRGYSAPRAFCVLDNSYNVLKVAAANTDYVDHVVEIDTDGSFIFNSFNSGFTPMLKGEIRKASEPEFDKAFIPNVFETISNVQYDSSSMLSYDEIIAGYDALVSAYSGQITKTSLGVDSSGDYTIYRYDFTPTKPAIEGNNQGIIESYSASDFPVVYMDACIHGGERPCARAVLNLMHKIYTSTDNDLFGWLKDHVRFVVVPVVNPYGYANGIRKNANGVDLNRNFVPFFLNGDDDSSSEFYRGASALSEVESQYVNAILNEIKDERSVYLSWHTHGVFSAYNMMTCYAFPYFANGGKHQVLANDLINIITRSGHQSHELPSDSGYIGVAQVSDRVGTSVAQGTLYGISSACPEVMYKYYDGTVGTDYSTKVNCMNAEYVMLAVTLMYKYFI